MVNRIIRLAFAAIAFVIAGFFIGLGLVEYGKVLGIEDLLQKQARQAGAAESCHTCSVETSEERSASFTYSTIGIVIGAFGVGSLIITKRSMVTMK